ncbi:MAG TPA: hypothetical protein VFO85_15230 [Vicinamibacteria bacterium]|nr:hypothetical protein [Vicinamibacteria bacterium]
MSAPGPEQAEAVADEQRRLRRLRMVVDITTAVLMQGRLTPEEALDVVATARARALELFPDKEATYDLILAPRFERLMREFVQPARVLPFRR